MKGDPVLPVRERTTDMLSAAVDGATHDDDEVLSAASSPEAPPNKKPKKDPKPEYPASVTVIDLEEQAKHVYSDEGSPESTRSPPFKMTETGVELRHPNAHSGDFLVERDANKSFGGAYPRCVKALKAFYKAVKGDANPSSIGLARFAGWVRTAPSIAQGLTSPTHRWVRALCAGRGLALGRARRLL